MKEIGLFLDMLLAYNKKVNLVSRRSTKESLAALVGESLLLKEHIAEPLVIDAGSGGGLLGIPLALALPGKEFVLVETIGKKAVFLGQAVAGLALANASVWPGSMREFVRHRRQRECTVVSRGFPDPRELAELVLCHKVRQLLLISSAAKIDKIRGAVANFRQKRYNIPLRDNLVLFELENVSRETRR
ncbi:MAG: class I SAM-dependent methyltransferase [Candidatus Aminicenantes bacterium]|nr:class I SAM-dependent methyltransferase [Candidatus Aminicenantes bacterium]